MRRLDSHPRIEPPRFPRLAEWGPAARSAFGTLFAPKFQVKLYVDDNATNRDLTELSIQLMAIVYPEATRSLYRKCRREGTQSRVEFNDFFFCRMRGSIAVLALRFCRGRRGKVLHSKTWLEHCMVTGLGVRCQSARK
jgi:hypothetical protein